MARTQAAKRSGAPAPPPARPQGGGVWTKRLEPFIGTEGWFQVEGEYAKSMVTHLKRVARGDSTYGYKLPPGRWEFTGRRAEGQPEGRCLIWVQYVGPAEDAA